MKTVQPGHKYELENMEEKSNQHLVFIEKEDKEGVLTTVCNGTTNEEVLKMLIDRMNFLQAKAPCRENAIVITKLEECLMWLEKRTAGKVARGVEGTSVK